jgi:hypothetical protein
MGIEQVFHFPEYFLPGLFPRSGSDHFKKEADFAMLFPKRIQYIHTCLLCNRSAGICLAYLKNGGAVHIFSTGGAMFRIGYSHHWKIRVPREDVWLLFSKAFENSTEVSEWPNSINEIHNQSKDFAAGAYIQATYRLGFLRDSEPYVIQQIIPEQRIVYDTRDEHPLNGQSQIDLIDVVDGPMRSTEVHWHGFYEPKSFSSIPTLLLFKFFFERIFFMRLEQMTKNAIRIKKTRHRVIIDQVA